MKDVHKQNNCIYFESSCFIFSPERVQKLTVVRNMWYYIFSVTSFKWISMCMCNPPSNITMSELYLVFSFYWCQIFLGIAGILWCWLVQQHRMKDCPCSLPQFKLCLLCVILLITILLPNTICKNFPSIPILFIGSNKHLCKETAK